MSTLRCRSKQAITGYGRASKEQVQEMVRLLLSLAVTPQPMMLLMHCRGGLSRPYPVGSAACGGRACDWRRCVLIASLQGRLARR